MVDEASVRRFIELDERGDFEWYQDDNGGSVAELKGIVIRLCRQYIDRTHDGIVLTLFNQLGVPVSLREPFEKERAGLRDDLRKLYASAEKKARGYEDLWKRLSRQLAGYDKL